MTHVAAPNQPRGRDRNSGWPAFKMIATKHFKAAITYFFKRPIHKNSHEIRRTSLAVELRDENEMNDYFLGGKQGRMTTTCSGWEKFLSKRPARLQFFQFRQIPWGCVVSSLPLLLRYLIVLSVCMCHYVLAAAIWNSCEIFQLIWMSMSMHETADDGAVPTRKYPETIVWNNKERIHFSKRISWEN